jgi:hypothetical protein
MKAINQSINSTRSKHKVNRTAPNLPVTTTPRIPLPIVITHFFVSEPQARAKTLHTTTRHHPTHPCSPTMRSHEKYSSQRTGCGCGCAFGTREERPTAPLGRNATSQPRIPSSRIFPPAALPFPRATLQREHDNAMQTPCMRIRPLCRSLTLA